MIYIYTLILCLFLAWKYDFQESKKYKQECYNFIMVWFILVSALQYMVGGDIPTYIEKFSFFPSKLTFNLLLRGGEERLQPGWVLLSWICRRITEDFLLMKMIQAVFLNFAVFSFFKRESKYMFLCVFFYAVSSYLVLNFNILRQSYSVAFGLYAISFFKNGKYHKFALLCFFSYMFHNSAVLLLLIPMLKFVKLNRRTVYFVIAGFLFGLYVLFRLDFEVVFNALLDSGAMDNNTQSVAMLYMENERLGIRDSGVQLSFHLLLIIAIIIYYLKEKKDIFIGGLGVFYLFIVILTLYMPIIWRFRLYFEFGYYVLLADSLAGIALGYFKQIRLLFFTIALSIFFYYPYRDYFRRSPVTKMRYIDQYYPYHSIFDPVKEKRF